MVLCGSLLAKLLVCESSLCPMSEEEYEMPCMAEGGVCQFIHVLLSEYWLLD